MRASGAGGQGVNTADSAVSGLNSRKKTVYKFGLFTFLMLKIVK